MVTDLIAATLEEDVLRRDIYDRPPIFKWAKGRVALLGDSAHAMQPNLGQGGCMAIEDAYELAKIVSAEIDKGSASALDLPYTELLKRYQNERLLRAAVIHGLARMAAIAASTYRAYLGEEWHLEDRIKIMHPGRMIGRIALRAVMPAVLSWVLGGNAGKIQVQDRARYCRIDDVPRGFSEKDWGMLIADDEALREQSQAVWVLVPQSAGAEVCLSEPFLIVHCSGLVCLTHADKLIVQGLKRNTFRGMDGKPIYCGNEGSCRLLRSAMFMQARGAVALTGGVEVGSSSASDVHIEEPGVCPEHATVQQEAGKFYVTDLGSQEGTWLNGRQLRANLRAQLHPGDYLEFGGHGPGACTFKVKQMHHSQKGQGLLASNTDGTARRYHVEFPHEA
jgi:zeaxanthin epoxidase